MNRIVAFFMRRLSVRLGLTIVLLVAVIFMPLEMTTVFGATIPKSMVLMALCGFCTSIMWSSIFNLAVEGLGAYTERASGLFMALVCGGGILPLLMNGVVDIYGISGYQPSYWVAVAGFAYILYYALVGSKPVNKGAAKV